MIRLIQELFGQTLREAASGRGDSAAIRHFALVAAAMATVVST